MHDATPLDAPADAAMAAIRGWTAGHQRPSPDAPPLLPYAAIVRYVRDNLSRRIAVGELAGIARLSVFQLSRALRREHATTPYRLVLEVRIEHAKERLKAGMTIAEAAFQAGFADQSHLTRHFKRLTGMTPKRYSAWREARDAARRRR